VELLSTWVTGRGEEVAAIRVGFPCPRAERQKRGVQTTAHRERWAEGRPLQNMACSIGVNVGRVSPERKVVVGRPAKQGRKRVH
jgi:hypothetical protein